MKRKSNCAAVNKSISLMVLGSLTGSAMMASSASAAKKADREPDKPNVILILTDDQGYGDLSVNGNPVLKTPNLDRLHDQSIRFTDFHVAPMSSPSRGQIMTGRDAYADGCTAVCMGRSMVREELPTIANVFKASGYKTVHIGKWHMGDSYPYRPQDRGFDVTVHHGAWGIGSIADYYKNTYWDAVYDANGKTSKFDGYCTDVWFDLARDYILETTKSHEAYFMYLATNCPHAPHLCDNSYSDPYKDKVHNLQEAKFFGQIANIDENVGRLMSFLDSLGVADNTVLIYMTDNGSSGGYNVYNAGMRGHKTEPYEGGHRVPLFIRWPEGNLGQPRDIDALTECQDLFPTLIDLCNLKRPDDLKLDGQSLLPLFKGNTKDFDDRMLVVQYDITF
jgi:arylsulfatase